MRGWRMKFIFILIVYFAGFSTAIYCLAPAPENQGGQSGRFGEENSILSSVNTQEFAQSFNSGLHKCIEFSKDAAMRAAKYIKQQLDERQITTDG